MELLVNIFFQITNNDDSIPFWIEMKFVGLLEKLVLYLVAIWHVNTLIVSFCSNKVVLIRISDLLAVGG